MKIFKSLDIIVVLSFNVNVVICMVFIFVSVFAVWEGKKRAGKSNDF